MKSPRTSYYVGETTANNIIRMVKDHPQQTAADYASVCREYSVNPIGLTSTLAAMVNRGFLSRVKKKLDNGWNAYVYTYASPWVPLPDLRRGRQPGSKNAPKPKDTPEQVKAVQRNNSVEHEADADKLGLRLSIRINGNEQHVKLSDARLIYNQLHLIFGGK